MTRSEFFRAVTEEFGGRAAAILYDLSLAMLNGLTANAALESGVAPKDIWLALCTEAEVPTTRRYGVGRREPKV